MVLAVRDAPTVGLLTAFEREGCRVVAVVDDTTQARIVIEEHQAGLLVIDHDLPGNALRLADDMSRRGAGVIVRGPTEDELEVFAALAAACWGASRSDCERPALALAVVLGCITFPFALLELAAHPFVVIAPLALIAGGLRWEGTIAPTARLPRAAAREVAA